MLTLGRYESRILPAQALRSEGHDCGARHANQADFDEQRGKTEGFGPVADVIGRLRKANRPGQGESDDGRERQQQCSDPGLARIATNQGSGGDDAGDDQADIHPAHVGRLIELSDDVEQVNETDAGKADDSDGAGYVLSRRAVH